MANQTWTKAAVAVDVAINEDGSVELYFKHGTDLHFIAAYKSVDDAYFKGIFTENIGAEDAVELAHAKQLSAFVDELTGREGLEKPAQ